MNDPKPNTTDGTSIRINRDHGQYIKEQAKKKKRATGEWAYYCVKFISEQGYDPLDTSETVNVLEAVKTLKNQHIQFIRKQEKDIINPLGQNVTSLFQLVNELTAEVKTLRLIEPEKETSNQTNHTPNSSKESSDIHRYKALVKQQQQEKQKLFSALLAVKNAINERKGTFFLNLPANQINEIRDLVK